MFLLGEKKYILAVAAAIFLFLLPGGIVVRAAERLQPTGDPIVIVIDPGHGGDNLGTESGHTLEKEMTLVTARAMFRELEQYDNVKVYLTRSDDSKVTLESRAEYASSVGADFLFSIHYNASEDHNLFGSEVWVSCETPYNAYGYQFGYEHLLSMEEMGLFVRGVKTRISKGRDYYGILREASARSIPAVIIEHCYVDEDTDAEFIESEADWEHFGRMDAQSVARYFGLKSVALGVDYSAEAQELQAVSPSSIVENTRQDLTEPDVCMIEWNDCDYSTGKLSLTVRAADYDSLLVYYDYSLDGGQSWSKLETWPDCNTLEREYTDTFQLDLQIPSGVQPSIVVRAYNITDRCTASNTLTPERPFRYGEETDDAQQETKNAQSETGDNDELTLPDHSRPSVGTTTFMPAGSDAVETKESSVGVIEFLELCLILMIALFVIVLITQIVLYHKRKKRRRNRK